MARRVTGGRDTMCGLRRGGGGGLSQTHMTLFEAKPRAEGVNLGTIGDYVWLWGLKC